MMKIQKMKLEEMLTGIDFDVDVCDDYADDGLPVAFCPPTALTEDGRKEFADILDLDVEIYEDSEACVLLNDKENCEHLHKVLKRFVWSLAGYCADDDWKKWFYYPDEE